MQEQIKTPTPLENRPDWGLMRLSEVLEVMPIKKTAWYEGIKKGKYPPGEKLGARVRCWRVRDIKNLTERINRGELA